MESILQEIFKDIVLEKSELKKINRSSKKMVLKRGDFLLKPGEVVKDIFYIHDGCLRTFFLDSEGREHTLQFAIKGWWISDYIALFNENNKGAVSYIECIKNATLVKISKKDFDNLCLEIPKVSQFHIKKLESAFASFHRQILGNLNLSAKDRYIHFVKNYPEIEQNVKNYHVASFLGITSESLSRIRKEIST
jgi:CRP-like cAMP-binding protein